MDKAGHEIELTDFMRAVRATGPTGVGKLWAHFWMQWAGRSLLGRTAARLAEWGVGPYQGRFYLATITPRGYVSPRAVISHRDLTIGAHSFIGDDVVIYQRMGGGPVTLGKQALLKHDIVLNTGLGGRIDLGDYCDIQHHCIFNANVSPIRVGTHVMIASFCCFMPYNHGMDVDKPMAMQALTSKGGIFVGDDVWIGIGVTVLDGVRIGDGAVVGAGAVVTKDVPDGAVVAGVPARIVTMRGSL